MGMLHSKHAIATDMYFLYVYAASCIFNQ